MKRRNFVKQAIKRTNVLLISHFLLSYQKKGITFETLDESRKEYEIRRMGMRSQNTYEASAEDKLEAILQWFVNFLEKISY